MPKRSSSSSTPSPKKKKSSASPPVAPKTRKGTSSTQVTNDVGILKQAFFAYFGELSTAKLSNRDVTETIERARNLSNLLQDDVAAEKKIIVDQLMRDYLLKDVLMENRQSWKNFLELSIILAKGDICNTSVIFSLISDMVELSSIKQCQDIFEFVETHLETWKDPAFLNSGKNDVLRMCNDLLRRLSRAQNTIFCGRILIFLSKYFPFSERSGLNIMSEFNSENVTVYKTNDGTDDPDDKMDVVEEKNEELFAGIDIQLPGLDKIVQETQEERKNKIKVDYNLYVKFWSLHEFFRNPLQCYNKIAWKTFECYTKDVLSVFNSFKLDEVPKTRRKQLRALEKAIAHDSSMIDIPKLQDESLYFAKYLTNRRLLELQMNDPSFRRYFLVQLLIILQYLTSTVKFKNDGHILSEEQQDYVKKTTDRIYHLLEEIPPGGSRFVNAVKHVLSREQLWNQWKNDGCPPFKKPLAVTTTTTTEASKVSDKSDEKVETEDDKGTKASESSKAKQAAKAKAKADEIATKQIEDTSRSWKNRRHLGDIMEEAAANGQILMGNTELSRLWNICGDNLEACRSKARDFTPPIDVFFAEAMKEVDMDPPFFDPKKEVVPKKILGNANFGWRALRLLARKSPYFFQMFQGAPFHPLQTYLEYILRKILAEKEAPVKAETPERPVERVPPESKEPNTNNDVGTNAAEVVKKEEKDEDQDHEMEGEVEGEDRMMQEDERQERHESEEEEEGEVNDKVRTLTTDEVQILGKMLEANWKKLALRLRFTQDEIKYIEENCGSEYPGIYLLERWQDTEGDEATVADLVYTMEGIGLKDIADKMF